MPCRSVTTNQYAAEFHGKPLLPRQARRRNLQTVTVEKHEYVRIGARINPQCSAERMDFAIEERLHRTTHEHLFQLLNAANGGRTSEGPWLVDSRCDSLKSVS